MKKYGIESIRNVGLFGHQGAGKTTLAEAMLFTSGAIDRMGRTDDGTAATDFDPEEAKRHISINIGVAPCEWGATKINLLDVPGYLDFQGEVRLALRVSDAAILVTSAQGDVEVGFEIAWDLAEASNHPRAVFVNKMDRENADYFGVVERLRGHYGNCIAPVHVPIGSAATFTGLVDLVHMRAYTGVGKEFKEIPIPDDVQATADTYREKLIESAAEGADDLMEKFFETGTLSDDEVVRGLHEGIDAGRVVPIMCGSASRNMGAATLMNLISEAFPNPSELGDAKGTSPDGKAISLKASDNEKTTALVFKTIADPFVGQLNYFRVMSGTIKSDSHIWNSCSGKDERIGQLYFVRGKSQEPTQEVHAGDVGAVAKLANTHTNDTLCEQSRPVILEKVGLPHPIFEVAVVAKSKVDEDKLGPAMQRVAGEDPTFTYRRDPVTGQTILGGVGDTHLNIVVEKLKKFGASVVPEEVKVPYRETILGKAEGQGKHKKQSGGRGQYGDCWIKLEPMARGEGFQYVDAIVGGSIPRQYIPAVEKGVHEALLHGLLSGNPVVDVKCTVYDGSYHDVDSSEAAFKMAGMQAFHTVVMNAQPVILEPMLTVSVTVPEDLMGDVMSDLSGKRGRIIGTEATGKQKMCVKATVPQSEMQRFAIDLRSISHGRGTFEFEPSHYEEVPAHIAQDITADYKKRREEHQQHH
ncbi:MAG: elongation factor G [Chthonomonadales bacterium]